MPGSGRILGKVGCYSGYHGVKLGATQSFGLLTISNFLSAFHAGKRDRYEQVAGTGLDRVNVSYQERC